MSVSKATVLDAFGWFKDLIIAEVQERIDAIEPYSLPTASRWQKGGVMIGAGLSMSGNTLNCTISSGTLDLVTQTDNGLMRATDKVKLDGIANGAQANVIENISLDGKNQIITNKTAQLDLSAYVKKTEIASGVRMKGSVNSFADLPATAEVGDLYNVKTAGGVDSDGTPIEAGDNVVFTDKGTLDVMAGLIDLSGYAKLTDIAGLSNYTLPTASATQKGGVMIGNGLSMAGDTLNCTIDTYTLPTASETQKGGVMIGDGLQMQGDTLNVTLKAETYSEFTGATASVSGSKGLVPAPKSSDQKNFLCGDGTWADPSRFVHVVIGGGDSATASSSSVSTIQGGLWQDLINGVPCLKLRYGDYEYNFYYDTTNRVGGADTSLDTTTKGVEYVLSTVPSSQDGQLWYEVNNNVPTLMVHKWAYNYGFNYDTITYKGSNSYLWSYMPFESTLDDALGNFNWNLGNTTIAPAPCGGNALKSTGSTARSGNFNASGTGTIDFWLSFDSINNFPQDNKYYSILQNAANTASSSKPFWIYLKNGDIVVSNSSTGDPQCSITKKRTHVAITYNKSWVVYFDGKLIKSGISSGQYRAQLIFFWKLFNRANNVY